MINFHIQILNERFLSRYGVDRILLLMASYFVKMGARVSFGCLRYNPEMFSPDASIVKLPAYSNETFENVEKFTSAEKVATDGMMGAWLIDKPDVVLIGGWPFFDLAARAGSVGVRTVFIDAGAVPHTGYSASSRSIQQELRRIRAQTLPFIDKVLPISDFIRYSQTEPDRCSSIGVRTIHLGADHLRDNISQSCTRLLDHLKSLKRGGCRLILAAGRFEPIGYKNSMSAVHVLRGVSNLIPNVMLLILHQPEHLMAPEDIANLVVGIGNPTDFELLEIYRLVDLTLSTSLWEGFNLPLAEAQAEGCPTLVYSCGSHPEVVADPWFLCRTELEMSEKSAQILLGQMPDIAHRHLTIYNTRYTWKKTLAALWEEMSGLLKDDSFTNIYVGRRLVFVDTTKVSLDSLDLETYRFGAALFRYLVNCPGLEVIFVRWHATGCFFALETDYNGVSRIENPLSMFSELPPEPVSIERIWMGSSQRSVLPPLLLFPIVPPYKDLDTQIAWARSKGLISSAIVYDTASRSAESGNLSRKGLSPAEYFKSALCMDALIYASSSAYRAVADFASHSGVALTQYCRILDRPVTFRGAERATEISAFSSNEINIIGVQALGSNSDYLGLIEAFANVRRSTPGIELKLTLIGASPLRAVSYGDNVEVLDLSPSISFETLVSKARFVVCPSTSGNIDFIVFQALWAGRPCLRHDDNDTAEDGGCLTVNMRSVSAIERGLTALIDEGLLYRRLSKEASSRSLFDWESFIDEIEKNLLSI